MRRDHDGSSIPGWLARRLWRVVDARSVRERKRWRVGSPERRARHVVLARWQRFAARLASPSPRPGTADACSGTAENRDFYSALAASVAWDVYCATLPPGWFVESGSYRLSNGGQLSITYKGPDGARLVIREGGYCVGHPDCVPSGTDAGAARFGDRDARLLDIGNGSWLVVVVPAGADVDWQAAGTGMDGAALGAFTVAFARVDQ